MKKYTLFLLVLLLILVSTVSCNKKAQKPSNEGTQTSQNTVTSTTSTTTVTNEMDPDNLELDGINQNTPSTKLIVEDLKISFSQINKHSVVTDAQTDKSFTAIRQFEITLIVSAQSKYADWNYTAFMRYQTQQ